MRFRLQRQEGTGGRWLMRPLAGYNIHHSSRFTGNKALNAIIDYRRLSINLLKTTLTVSRIILIQIVGRNRELTYSAMGSLEW